MMSASTAFAEAVTDIYAEVKCKISECIVNKPMHICDIVCGRFLFSLSVLPLLFLHI